MTRSRFEDIGEHSFRSLFVQSMPHRLSDPQVVNVTGLIHHERGHDVAN
jgi:hypothetical protein